MDAILKSTDAQKFFQFIDWMNSFVKDQSHCFVGDVFQQHNIDVGYFYSNTNDIPLLNQEVEKVRIAIEKMEKDNERSHKIINSLICLVNGLKSIVDKEDFDIEIMKRTQDGIVNKLTQLETEKCEKEVSKMQTQIEVIQQKIMEKEKELDGRKKQLRNKKVVRKDKIDSCYEIQSEERNVWKCKEVLLNWVSASQMEVIYDTDTNECTNEIFSHSVLNKSNLYFICNDSNDNVFGIYCSQRLATLDCNINDENMFLFSLKQNHKLKLQKFDLINKKDSTITVWKNKNCLFGVGGINGWLAIHKTHFDSSRCCFLSKWFCMNDEDLNGTYWTDFHQQRFSINRLMVLKIN